MISSLLIVSIILLGLVLFYLVKIRKSIASLRLSQDMMADEIAEKINEVNEKYVSQYTDLMTELREYKEAHKQGEELGEDELYESARELVIDTQKASTTFLQRRFGIGYSRAAQLIDMLENEGVIGPAQGSKAREVFEKEEIE